MSRRKQSNPKPLKSETHDKLEYSSTSDSEPRKGEAEDWSGDGADTTAAEGGSPPAGSPKSKSPDPPPPEDARKTSPKPDPDEKPRIRLKTNLATDPALLPTNLAISNLKTELDPSIASLPPAIQSALVSRGLFLSPTLSLPETIASLTPRPAEPAELRQSVAFQCLPCGIRFSSLSTLEAHQTYYCSHRANKNDDDSKSTNADGSGNQSDVDGEPANKNQRTGKQYTCTHCSYSADKKVSLNRHMRMHTVSPSPAAVPAAVPNGEPGADNQDRYCAECDIRFSSQKTYRAHKMHYCNSRHVVKPALPAAKAASSCTSGSSPTSPVDATTCRTPPSPGTQNSQQQQPFLALPTNPILILPYSLFRSASVLPGLAAPAGLPNADTPYVLLPNGALQPISSAIASGSSNSHADVLKSANKSKDRPVSRESSSAPLDLTMRKSPEPKDGPVDLRSEHEKENFKRRSPSPEKIECVPSLHGSPPLTSAFTASSPSVSVSPKRKYDETSRSSSPRLARTPKSSGGLEKSRTSPEINPIPPFDIPASLHPLLMRPGGLPALFTSEVQMRLAELPASVPPAIPQVLVKQGVSKCKECNIVFCKHENYVIHKKHYCSARNVDDDASKTSGSPPVSPRSAGTTSPAAQYQQLICLACGIKFTSLDNLNAHQQYYCLKRGELEARKCGKCRGPLEAGHQCPPPPTVLAGWKCPCCDVVSTTASAAQRHMETHSAVKAYRCTICRYKGNTLRGMRTHIRMHFDKRSPDLQEEKYITYILETDGANTLEVPSTDERAASPESESRTEPLYHCNFCPYSSDYKANVQRHMKLIHESSSEETLSNGNDEKNPRIVDDEEEIIVKKEAIEPEVIIAAVDDAPVIKKEVVEATSTKSKEEEAMQEGRKYCKSCDISFTYYKSFLAHKKYYCLSHAGEISAASANDNNNTTTRAAETSVL